MKKFLLPLIGIAMSIPLITGLSGPKTVHAEPLVSSESTSESVDVVYPCNVILENYKYGDMILDITGGNVGDIVTMYAKPYTLCALKSVSVNGTDLIANEDGNYTFALIEGDNVVSAVFEVDTEQMAALAELLANAKNGNWEDIFSLDNLFTFIYWGMTTLLSSGFFITLLKYKNVKAKTVEQVSKAAELAINTGSAEAINEFLSKTFGPSFDKISERLSNTDETCKTLARCFVLSQENTPEARLAIIQELTKLQSTNEELTEQVKLIINQEVSKNKEIQDSKLKAIKELEEANKNIGSNVTTTKSDEDNYGQF